MTKDIDQLLKDKSGIRLDIGCGSNKNAGFVGIDYKQYGDVDIVHNIEVTPWPLPDECVVTAVASHLLEHITPHSGDSRLQPLIDLLVSKKVISQEEADQYVGQPGPAFMRVMDEVWRVLKPRGQFAFVVPYAGSDGFHQDPTHCNPINETTMHYFDPDPEGHNIGAQLYNFYRPRPWKIVHQYYNPQGNLEVLLEKRPWDKSYGGEAVPFDITQELAQKGGQNV